MFEFVGFGILIIFLILGSFLFVGKRRKFSPEISERDLELLKREMEKWEREKIISQDQIKAIVDWYLNIQRTKKPATLFSRLIKIFSTLGAILVGLGIILWIAANIRIYPPSFYLFILVSITLLCYWKGWDFKYQKKSSPRLGESLIFLGTLLTGACLIYSAQVYHIRIEYSNLLLLWFILIFPIGYLVRSLPILSLSNLIILTWGIFSFRESFFYFYYYPPEIHFPVQFYLSFLFSLFFFPIAYKLKSLHLVALNLLICLIWIGWYGNYKLFFKSHEPIVDFSFLYLLVGLIVFVIGYLHEKLKNYFKKYEEFKLPYLKIGTLLLLLSSYLLTFPQIYFRETNLLLPFLFNIVLLGEICALIYFGLIEKNEFFVNTSLFFFGLLVIARYFSITWELEERAFAFILGGILLLGGSYLLRKLREKLIEKMGKNEKH
jgi:uncharacterized membrane protein